MADLILEYTTSDNMPISSTWLNSHSNVFNPETGRCEVTLEDGETEIGIFFDGGTSAQTTLTQVFIPEGVLSIGYRAFNNCRGLEKIEFPKTLTRIGENAFSGCNVGLQTIAFPSTVTTISNGVFGGCSKLNHIILHDTMKSIGDGAFAALSSSFKYFICEAKVPPALHADAFRNATISKKCILYVPTDSVDAYINSEWGVFFKDIRKLNEAETPSPVPPEPTPVSDNPVAVAFESNYKCLDEIMRNTYSRIVSGDYIDAVMEYRKTSGVLRSISMLMTENGML